MANYLIYIPIEHRQENFRASCVHASVVNCMRSVGLKDAADQYWQQYRGDFNGENAGSISSKLKQFGVKHCIARDEQSLINSLKWGRGAAVTWGGAHCVNLVGLIDGNAYIVDNNGPGTYRVQSWAKFLSNWRRCGHWAVIILDGKPVKPIKGNMDEYLKMFYKVR